MQVLQAPVVSAHAVQPVPHTTQVLLASLYVPVGQVTAA